ADELLEAGFAILPAPLRRWIRGFELFEQPHRTEPKALTKMLNVRLAKNEFGAATADIENQNGLIGEGRGARDPGKNPVCFLFTGNNLNPQAGSSFDSLQQFRLICRVPRGARGNDPD